MKEQVAPEEDQFEDCLSSFHQAEKTTDDPLIRVMALHALAYCERLFYLEEVEEIRVADANVYAGRRIHEELDRGEDRYTVELASERLGIRGKMDCVRRKSGGLVVCEHKKGKSKEGKEAWPSDRLQVLAYALLLAEHTGEALREAEIRYHADKRTVVLSVDLKAAEGEVRQAVARARELRRSLERPAVAVPERLCRTCSLAPVCLPEEERFVLDPEAKPQRLFPPEDGQVIHVVEQGSSIRKDGEQLVVHLPDGSKKPLPGISVTALVLHGNVQVSTQCIHFCAARSIGLHWLSFGGHYVAALASGAGGVQRRNRQYAALQDAARRIRLVLRLATAKLENQLRYVLRNTRSKTDGVRPAEVGESIARLRQELAALARMERGLEADSRINREIVVPGSHGGLTGGLLANEMDKTIEEIRGHEGAGAREYFHLLASFLNLSEDDPLRFSGRSRRPPRDPFNALLSFGYALLYRDCINALLAVGLEPAFGLLHTPRSAAYPLALDLMELFRVILWDVPLVGSVNRRQWKPDDFEITTKQVWLNLNGRRKAIQLYESRKQEKWKHPVLDYSLTYARTIELEARLLEKEWSGQPGLFAKLRLR
ncbi:MAG TPA: CRISPR-associated endonuclease Cas1 [Syntrophobacter fumaroxidans]|nr:CRISPR-associated endonuclease Cas1 [Syntrophobacter fumaroxidans]